MSRNESVHFDNDPWKRMRVDGEGMIGNGNDPWKRMRVKGRSTSQNVLLPQVASATLLLDLEADMLSLADGDPVSTWADQSGNGHDFTQTGDARPIKQTEESYPAVFFDGLDVLMWMQSTAFADNLDDFAVFSIAKIANPSNDTTLISKLDNNIDFFGWYAGLSAITVQNDTDLIQVENDNSAEGRVVFKVRCFEFHKTSTAHVFVNGDNSTEQTVSSGSISNYSNTEPVRLGLYGAGIDSFTGFSGWQRALLIYQITDPDNWATDRAAITTWLADRYGVTL